MVLWFGGDGFSGSLPGSGVVSSSSFIGKMYQASQNSPKMVDTYSKAVVDMRIRKGSDRTDKEGLRIFPGRSRPTIKGEDRIRARRLSLPYDSRFGRI